MSDIDVGDCALMKKGKRRNESLTKTKLDAFFVCDGSEANVELLRHHENCTRILTGSKYNTLKSLVTFFLSMFTMIIGSIF